MLSSPITIPVDGYAAIKYSIRTVLTGDEPTTVHENDVEFIDYDGSIVASYSAADFANLTALPANPSHTGLTAQGWNWTLSDAKDYVAAHGALVIGQVYITDDGKTRIYITSVAERPTICVSIAVNGTATIDWGDGTTPDTVTGTSASTLKDTTHTYAAQGDYVIAIGVTGTMAIGGDQSNGSRLVWSGSSSGNSIYRSMINKVEVGANCDIMTFTFNGCVDIETITIPNGVSFTGNAWASGCYSLKSITIPKGVTNLRQSAFKECYDLKRVSLGTGLTQLYQYAFNDCRVLRKITLPTGMTQIGSEVFKRCDACKVLTFPNSMTGIADSACYYMVSLPKLTIPASVTSISSSAFYYNAGLEEIHFKPTTPPTVGSNAFQGLPTDCKIYVPTGSLSAYTGAGNYPNSSTYTYIEE